MKQLKVREKLKMVRFQTYAIQHPLDSNLHRKYNIFQDENEIGEHDKKSKKHTIYNHKLGTNTMKFQTQSEAKQSEIEQSNTMSLISQTIPQH